MSGDQAARHRRLHFVRVNRTPSRVASRCRRSSDTTTSTTTGIHAADQLLVSTTPYYAHLSPLLLRARGAPQDLDRPGGTELRPVPPHCSRDLGHGPGAGSVHLTRLQPPTCSRPVSGVSLGHFCMRGFNAVSRPQLSCCSSLCDGLRCATVVSKRMLSR